MSQSGKFHIIFMAHSLGNEEKDLRFRTHIIERLSPLIAPHTCDIGYLSGAFPLSNIHQNHTDSQIIHFPLLLTKGYIYSVSWPKTLQDLLPSWSVESIKKSFIPPLVDSPYFFDFLNENLTQSIQDNHLDESQTECLLVAHGHPNNPPQPSLETLWHELRTKHHFHEDSSLCFIKQTPYLHEKLSHVNDHVKVILSLFITEGYHFVSDIPHGNQHAYITLPNLAQYREFESFLARTILAFIKTI